MTSPTGDAGPASRHAPSSTLRSAELVPAVVAPLLALAATIAGAVVVLLVLLLASLTGLDTSDLDPSGAASDGGMMALLALPFQVAALGLLGTLSLDVSAGGQSAGASAFAPVYLLTALYVVALARLARRRPATTTSPLAIAVASSSAAVVAVVVVRLLAIRADGVVLHAASPTLFFGVAALSAATLAVVRWRSAGSGVPARWAPYVAALRLVGVQLAVTAVLLTPFLVVGAAVSEGIGAGMLVLVLLPTVLIYCVGLGSLAPVSVAGSSEYLWGDSVVAAVLLLLVVLVAALVAAVARHLRRTSPAESDPTGWAALPAAWGATGVLLWLASVLVVSGGFAGFGGSARVQLGWTLLLLMPLWGLAVEAASRYVAPTLAPVLPERLRTRLRSREAADTDGPARELTEAERRRLRRGLLVGGAALGVVVAAAVAIGVVNSTFYGPGAAAEAYLDTVVDGDAEQALELAPVDDGAGTALLTDEVYQATEGRPTGYDITDTSTYGDSARLSVSLEGVEGDGEVSMTLSRTGKRFGLFDVYEVDEGGLASPVTLGTLEAPEQIQVNGVEVATDGADQLLALPGSYAFDVYGDSPWIEAEPATVDVSPADFGTFVETSEPQPSQELLTEIQAQTDAWLEECLGRDELEPEDCPQSAFAFGDDVRKVEWTLESPLEVELDYFDGTFPTTFSASGGSASVTYESDQSYGIGRPDFQPDSDTSDLYVNGEVEVSGDDVTVTFETY